MSYVLTVSSCFSYRLMDTTFDYLSLVNQSNDMKTKSISPSTVSPVPGSTERRIRPDSGYSTAGGYLASGMAGQERDSIRSGSGKLSVHLVKSPDSRRSPNRTVLTPAAESRFPDHPDQHSESSASASSSEGDPLDRTVVLVSGRKPVSWI